MYRLHTVFHSQLVNSFFIYNIRSPPPLEYSEIRMLKLSASANLFKNFLNTAEVQVVNSYWTMFTNQKFSPFLAFPNDLALSHNHLHSFIQSNFNVLYIYTHWEHTTVVVFPLHLPGTESQIQRQFLEKNKVHYFCIYNNPCRVASVQQWRPSITWGLRHSIKNHTKNTTFDLL